jgi:hypothetical protein
MEDLARNRNDHEYQSGAWFRELAVKLTVCEDLALSAVTSDDGEVYELEVTLVSAGSQEPLTCLANRRGHPDTPTTGGAGNHSPGITLGYRAQCHPGGNTAPNDALMFVKGSCDIFLISFLGFGRRM